MVFFRAVVFLLLVASLLCFAMYVGTGQAKWRAIGLRILKWTLIAAMGFFAVLILERIPIPL
jgi:hypothetical protein